MSREIEEVKNRLDIVDVVSEYVKLKQAGTNWKAPCPFHNEKSPSFMVSRDKQIWHCFGCGKGGDVFSFVQEIDGMDFPSALQHLAQKAGVQLPSYQGEGNSKKKRLKEICSLTAQYWNKVLRDADAAQVARDYLQQRGVSDETAERFVLGYAPKEWEATLQFLIKRGYTEQEIFLAGITVKKDRGSGFFDRFRHRLMFPLKDVQGQVVGFTGRLLDESQQGGKYVNTPQTELYNKSAVVYNLDQAKHAIRREGFVIVAEGQMDVIASVQAGVENIVAVSGTAFTQEQLLLLKRYTTQLVLAFDTDAAGESASRRSVALAWQEGFDVKTVALPEGKDPDDYIKQGADAWKKVVDQRQSIMQHYVTRATKRYDLTSVDGKKAATKELLPIISQLYDGVERTHWVQELSGLVNVPETILHEAMPKRGVNRAVAVQPVAQDRSEKTSTAQQPPKSRFVRVSEHLIGLLLAFPDHLPSRIDKLEPDILATEALRALYKQLIIYYTSDIQNNISDFEYRGFTQTLSSEQGTALADTLVLKAENDFSDAEYVAIGKEIDESVAFLRKEYYSQQLKSIEQQIKFAEDQHNVEEVQKLTQRFNEIIQQLHLL